MAPIVHGADIDKGIDTTPQSAGLLAISHGFALLDMTDERQLELELPSTTPSMPGVSSSCGAWIRPSVWAWLRAIPAGETRTYAQGAAAVGRPSAVHAVGRANGANPLAIVAPCHRVIGSSGDLTGYGGGLWRKRALLDLEAESVVHHVYGSATF